MSMESKLYTTETQETVKSTGALVEIEYLKDFYPRARSDFMRHNIFAVRNETIEYASIIAAKYFSTTITRAFLLFMPHRMCFYFKENTLLVPVYASDESFVYNNGKLISRCDQPNVFYGNKFGLVNTGQYSLSLVAQ